MLENEIEQFATAQQVCDKIAVVAVIIHLVQGEDVRMPSVTEKQVHFLLGFGYAH